MEIYFKVTKVTDKIPEIYNSDGVIGCDQNGFKTTIVHARTGFDVFGCTHFLERIKSIDKLMDEKDQFILKQNLQITELKKKLE